MFSQTFENKENNAQKVKGMVQVDFGCQMFVELEKKGSTKEKFVLNITMDLTDSTYDTETFKLEKE